jgi:hypothetical protein
MTSRHESKSKIEREAIKLRKEREHKKLQKQLRAKAEQQGVGIVRGNSGPRNHPVQPANTISLKHGKPSHKDVCSPEVNGWSELLASGMTVPNADVKMGLPGNGSTVPKESVTISNTGQLVLSGFSDTQQSATMWFFPDGGEDGKSFKPTGVQGGPTFAQPVLVGANVSPAESNLYSTPGYFRYTTDEVAEGLSFAATSDPGLLSIDIDPLDLVKVPEKPMDFNNRTLKFTVEISLISELTSTRGGIRVYNPYMPPGDSVSGGVSQLLKTTRRDRSYVDQPFSAKRSFTYTYMPNDKSVDFGQQTSAVNSTSVFLYDSRFVIQLYGLREEEDVLVRYVWVQEYTGTPVNSISTFSTVAADHVHVANAIPHMTNYEPSGRKNPTLAEHVAAMKVKARPVAAAMAAASGIQPDDHKALAKAAPSLLSELGGILGPLSLLL